MNKNDFAALWDTIGEEFLDRGCETLKGRLADVFGAVNVKELDEAIKDVLDDRTDGRGVLARSFESAAERPQRATLLATYLYARQQIFWRKRPGGMIFVV